uniref:Uncharacterized protein n=1 Tax=Anguilla anguilla TaxID=7936 RepID=A0A0E9SYG5_ANGAN
MASISSSELAHTQILHICSSLFYPHL